MKKLAYILGCVSLLALFNCNKSENAGSTSATAETTDTHSQEGVVDDTSTPNILNVAIKSADHSTLVTAVKAAGLATSLSNAGPFTVFAPTNAAFDKLPKGTVEDLLKPENQGKLGDILGHHTYVGVIKTEQMTDGQTLGMVDGKTITIKMVDGKPTINGTAHIVASVPASNGIIHVIDEVIVPQ